MDKGNLRENERVTKEREFEDDCYIHLFLFTAGTAVLMACLKRVLVVFLLEEWRAWVFLFLNLVLLAILFTSMLSRSKESQDCQKESNAEVKTEKTKKVRRQRSKCRSERQEESEEREITVSHRASSIDEKVVPSEDEVEPPRLSKEELNERAEAFIVMFRQHLVLDARKCGKDYLLERPGRVERVKFQTCAK